MALDETNRRVMAKVLAKRRLFKPDAIPFKSMGKAAAQKWLREIIDLAVKLQRHLNAMPLEVRKTGILFPEPGGPEIAQRLISPALVASKIIAGTTGRKGPRESRSANFAAWLTAEAFKEVTGKYPTVQEEQGLLELLLPKLGIDASPEHCVRVRRSESKKEIMHKK